jgi:hypothetical protein
LPKPFLGAGADPQNQQNTIHHIQSSKEKIITVK